MSTIMTPLDITAEDLQKLLFESDRKYFGLIGNNFRRSERANCGNNLLFHYNEFNEYASDMTYICLNPMKLNEEIRTKCNEALDRYSFTIEFDQIPIEDQWEIVKDIPSTIICFSGNKSLHTHLIFTEQLDEDQADIIYTLLKQKFISDVTTLTRSQFVRLPGGTNVITGNKQLIYKIGTRLNYNDTVKFLESLPSVRDADNSVRVKKGTTSSYTPIECNNIWFQYFESILDLELKTIRYFKKRVGKYNGLSGIYYDSNCPNNSRHTNCKTHDKEFNVFLSKDGRIIKKCFHDSCSDIWKTDLDKLFNIKEKIISDYYKEMFLKSKEAIKNNIRLEDLPGASSNSNNIAVDEDFDIVAISERLGEKLCPLCKDKFDIDSQTQVAVCSCAQLDIIDYIMRIMPDEAPNVSKAIEILIEVQDEIRMIKGIENSKLIPKPPTQNKSKQDALNALENISKGDALIISAPTGVGKTYMMCNVAISLIAKGQKVLMVGTYTHDARRLISLLRAMDVDPNRMSLVISGENDIVEEDRSKLEDFTFTHRDIIVTSYGYCGRAGSTAHGYSKWYKMMEDRVVFFDECHTILEKCDTDFQLVYRMFQKSDGCDFKATTHCPISSKRGIKSCDSCVMVTEKQALNVYLNREKYSVIKANTLSSYQNPSNLGIVSNQKPFDFTSYKKLLGGTTFDKHITGWKRDLVDNIDMNDNTELSFYESLSKCLYNPTFKVELPVDKVTKEYRPNCDMESQTPSYICETPVLKGMDTFPFQQLLGHTLINTNGNKKSYNGPHSIVFMSATIPDEFLIMSNDILSNKFKLRKLDINEIPVTFDVTLLKTKDKLGVRRQADIGSKLIASSEFADIKGFIVADKKSNALDLFSKLGGTNNGAVKLYEGKNYIRLMDFTDSNRDSQFILTYGRSSIMTGSDFKSYNFMMIDIGLFLPLSAIHTTPYMTQQEASDIHFNYIRKKITQALGRLLRTELQIVDGITIQDPRKIVFLLHNIPDELMNFEIDKTLTFNQVEVRETWKRTDPKRISESIVRSIIRTTHGEDAINYKPIQAADSMNKKEDMLRKAKAEGGLTALSVKNRELVKDDWVADKELRRAEKDDERFNKGVEMFERGESWGNIYYKLNLDRYPNVKDRLKNFKNNMKPLIDNDLTKND